MSLTTLKPKLATLSTTIKKHTTKSNRLQGLTLQNKRKEFWVASGGRCALCDRAFALRDMELDHIVPLLAGGSNNDSNLQMLCKECHASKTKLDLDL